MLELVIGSYGKDGIDVKIYKDLQNASKGITSDFIFIIAIAVISLISIISVIQFHNLLQANNWVIHTYQVIKSTGDSLNGISKIESQVNGFLLTGDKLFLDNLNDDISDEQQVLNLLTNLTSVSAIPNSKVHQLKEFIIDRLNQIVKMRSEPHNNSTQAQELYRVGQASLDQIANVADEITTAESTLLQERNAVAEHNFLRTNVYLIVGNGLCIGFLLLAYYLARKQLKMRIQSQSQLQHIQNQLHSIIEGAGDMIAAIDLNSRFFIFNEAYKNEFQFLFGKTIQIGMSIDEALENAKEGAEKFKEVWQNALAGNTFTQNLEAIVKEEVYTYEVTSSLVRSKEGELEGAVQIVRNITNRMQEQTKLKNAYEELHVGMQVLKLRNDKITLLVEMSDVMLACVSIDELGSIVSNYCRKILDFSSGCFYLMHPSRNFLEFKSSWLSPTHEVLTFAHDECWALRLGRAHEARSNDAQLNCKHIIVTPDVLYYCVPLMAQNDIYGLLYLEISVEMDPLPENEKVLITAFAELTALALANVRLRENLRFQSIRDPLTTLYNRRYLDEFLLKEIQQARRMKTPLSVLMLDLDHFKRVNDFYGHDAGDVTLKQVSQVLNENVRGGDLVARYGGEEFIFILYNTPGEVAFKRAEEIRKGISQLHIEYGAQIIGPVSISIGVAVFPRDGTSNNELIEAADKALYQAKNSGRNKVVSYSEGQKTQ